MDVPGYGKHKIKEAYGMAKADADADLEEQGVTDPAEREQRSRDAGRRSTIETVQKLLRVPIDHFAEVNLVGFYDIAEALGPLEVCLNAPVDDPYSGANFPAGRQMLDPSQALSFVRQRHGLANGDLDRTRRQQAFLTAVLRNLDVGGMFGSVSKMRGLFDTVKSDVVVDDDLDPVSFALRARNLTRGELDFHTLPIEGYRTVDGQAVNIVDPNRLRAEVAGLFAGESPTTTTATTGPSPTSSRTTRSGSHSTTTTTEDTGTPLEAPPPEEPVAADDSKVSRASTDLLPSPLRQQHELAPGVRFLQRSVRRRGLGQREPGADDHVQPAVPGHVHEQRTRLAADPRTLLTDPVDRAEAVADRPAERDETDEPIPLHAQRERIVDHLVGTDGVHDRVDPVRCDLVDPRDQAGPRRDRDGAESAQEIVMNGPGDAYRHGASHHGQLDGQFTDTAGRAVDDDGVPLAHVCDREGLVRRRARRQQAGCALPCQRFGFRQDVVHRKQHPIGVGALIGAHDHLVAHPDGVGAGTGLFDDAGPLHARADRQAGGIGTEGTAVELVVQRIDPDSRIATTTWPCPGGGMSASITSRTSGPRTRLRPPFWP